MTGLKYYIHSKLFNNLMKNIIGLELKHPDLVGIVDVGCNDDTRPCEVVTSG